MHLSQAVGRRKTSVARVYLSKGSGELVVNRRNLDDYFKLEEQRNHVKKVLVLTDLDKTMKVLVNVKGGGMSGQVGAISLGIARAILKLNPDHRSLLRTHDLLKRDSRVVERKKYGHRKARRSFQFSKR